MIAPHGTAPVPGAAARSGALVVAGRGLQLALQFGLVAVLSRILTPADMGLLAVVMPLAVLMQAIANSGLQGAIIQHRDLDEGEASALFWASLRWNTVLAVVMVAAGAVVAAILRDARVIPVAAAWAAVILVATASAIPEARLKRDFRFGTVLAAHLTAMVISVAAALWVVQLGARYWTLIIQMAVVELGRVALVMGLSRWRPLPRRALGAAPAAALAELRSFWRGFAGTRVATWMTEHVDRLVVAATWGTHVLGLYDYAKRWGTFAFTELYTPLTEVAIANLSRVRDDPVRLARAARQAFMPVLAVSIGVSGFLFAEPRGVLHVLFGAQWTDATMMLHFMAAATALGSLGRVAQWVSLATGGTQRQLRWMAGAVPVFLVGMGVGAWRDGADGVAAGVATATVVTTLPATWYLLARTGVRPAGVLACWVVPLVAAAVGVATLFLASERLAVATTLPGLLVRGGLFAVTYAVTWVAMPWGRALLREARRASVGPA